MQKQTLSFAFGIALVAALLAVSQIGTSSSVVAQVADTATATSVPPTNTSTPIPATFTSTATVTPTVTATPSGVTVTVTPTVRSLGCNGSTPVTIAVQTSAGAAPDGTAVTVSTNLGTLNQTSGTTTNGSLIVNFTAPPGSGGTATITGSSLGASGTSTVGISCGSRAPHLHFPDSFCAGGRADVIFRWSPPVAGSSGQWIDLTIFDNGFAPNTFIGAGPLDPSAGELIWRGLLTGMPHFWRVNNLTPDGWVVSGTGAFAPCSGPEIRGVAYGCLGAGVARVTFFWSPASPPGTQHWLDLSITNNGFIPGTFLGAGPLSPYGQEIVWDGILANVPHYWRMNTLFSTVWDPSATGAFVAAC